MNLRAVTAICLLAAALSACGSDPHGAAEHTNSGIAAGGPEATAAASNTPAPTPTATLSDLEIRNTYPDLAAIYAGDFGIYRSCGPNSGVCHNSKQYPNLRSLEAVLDTVGAPCNQLRENPLEVHDWCELPGDRLRIGGFETEIGFFLPVQEDLRQWFVFLRDPLPRLERQEVAIVRPLGNSTRVLFARLHLRAMLFDITQEVGVPALFIGFPPAPEGEERDPSLLLIIALLQAGIPGNPNVIQLGDPNRNGTFGADLQNALIVPGDPARSYLMRRLTDPQFGTLMPLANCCYWTRESLRALWCWIAGLDPLGTNALDPIDYATCPDGPVANVLYPEPGPLCETSGLCPVQAIAPPDGTGFAPVFAILRGNCAGSACHIGGNAGGFAIPAEEEAAYEVVLTRVVPGSPEQSTLYIRLDRELCIEPDCIPMPFGRPPLPEENLDTIRQWILEGAQR